jgi:hypothetical protein
VLGAPPYHLPIHASACSCQLSTEPRSTLQHPTHYALGLTPAPVERGNGDPPETPAYHQPAPWHQPSPASPTYPILLTTCIYTTTPAHHLEITRLQPPIYSLVHLRLHLPEPTRTEYRLVSTSVFPGSPPAPAIALSRDSVYSSASPTLPTPTITTSPLHKPLLRGRTPRKRFYFDLT